MSGAKIATSTMIVTTASPSTAPRFSLKDRQNECRDPGGAGATAVGRTIASTAMVDPGIDQAVKKIDDEVHQDDNTRNQHDAALESRIVAPSDRLDEPFADARPREDGLGQNRARKQRADGQA